MWRIKPFKPWTAIIFGVIGMVAIPLFVQAGAFGRPMHRGGGHGLMGMKTLLELNLSDSQRSELLGIIEKYRGEREKLRDRMRETGKNLRAAMGADEFNESRVREAYRKSSSVREEMFVLRAKMMDDIKKVLTDEQRAKLEEKRKQRIEKMKERVRTRF